MAGEAQTRGGERRGREAVALLRAVLAHDLPQLGAALTFYTVLSLLPALIVVVALVGMVGLAPDTVRDLLDALGDLGAPWAAGFVSDVLASVLASRNSGAVLVLSFLTSLWAASAYVGSFMAASDRIYEVPARRPFRTGLPLRLGLALLLLALLSATVAVLALVSPAGRWIAHATGVGGGLPAWTGIRWPLLVALGLLLFSVLYKFAPSRRQPSIWRLTPGAAVGVALWALGSAGFSLYLDHFAAYDRVYGTLATAVVFLVWAWLMNIALLVGAEVNRALEAHRTGPGTAPGRPAGDAAGDDLVGV